MRPLWNNSATCGVKQSMNFKEKFSIRKILRLIVWIALATIAALFLCAVVIQVDQHIMRRRAQALVDDLLKLQVGITTQDQGRQILRRWPEASVLQNCSNKCAFGVVLDDLSRKHETYLYNHQKLFRIYQLLGGRRAEFRAAVAFKNGVFESDSTGFYLHVAPYKDPTHAWTDYELIGGTSMFTKSQLDERHYRPDPLHPAYLVHPPGGCDGCVGLFVTFLPNFASSDRDRLMQFDFSCITRWVNPCRTQSDMMPNAWKQYVEDQASR